MKVLYWVIGGAVLLFVFYLLRPHTGARRLVQGTPEYNTAVLEIAQNPQTPSGAGHF